MSKYEMVAFIVAMISITSMISAVATAYFKRGSSGKRAELPAALDQRLTRIEQAVDAIAVEVERVSENQRFTTRLLAGRNGESGDGHDPAQAFGVSAFDGRSR
jgi:hypothetical protein